MHMQEAVLKFGMVAALLYLAILGHVASQDIVFLGDSLSDNGTGYAGYIKFVLQTNDVRSCSEAQMTELTKFLLILLPGSSSACAQDQTLTVVCQMLQSSAKADCIHLMLVDILTIPCKPTSSDWPL